MVWGNIWERIFGPKPPRTVPQPQIKPKQSPRGRVPNSPLPSIWGPEASQPSGDSHGALDIRRHFFNEAGFQTYGSFFAHWGGWITAGHVITDSSGLVPPFAHGRVDTWPGGLDACAIGCALPPRPPKAPHAGQELIIKGYPAGARHIESRRGRSYFERETGIWIAHILTPDEPVVTGMSGGAVLDAKTMTPIGILITRNSPADLNADRDPDESADFVALHHVWHALKALEEEGPLLTS